MPTRTRPPSSTFAHSCSFEYLSSLGYTGSRWCVAWLMPPLTTARLARVERESRDDPWDGSPANFHSECFPRGRVVRRNESQPDTLADSGAECPARYLPDGGVVFPNRKSGPCDGSFRQDETHETPAQTLVFLPA